MANNDESARSYTDRIEATREAEERWTAAIDEFVAGALFRQATSWYTGANIPDKKIQMLMYPGGLPSYLNEVNNSAAQGFPESVTA